MSHAYMFCHSYPIASFPYLTLQSFMFFFKKINGLLGLTQIWQ